MTDRRLLLVQLAVPGAPATPCARLATRSPTRRRDRGGHDERPPRRPGPLFRAALSFVGPGEGGTPWVCRGAADAMTTSSPLHRRVALGRALGGACSARTRGLARDATWAGCARPVQEWIDAQCSRMGRASVWLRARVPIGEFCENFTQPPLTKSSTLRFDRRGLPSGERRCSATTSRAALRPHQTSTSARDVRALSMGRNGSRCGPDGGANAAAASPGLLRAVAGLARYRRGRYSAPDSRRHASALTDSMRQLVRPPALGVSRHRVRRWSRARPRWLRRFNEIRLEYWAR